MRRLFREFYQQSTRMMTPTDDSYGCPPSPQVDGREVRPNRCMRRAGVSVRTFEAGPRDAVVELGGQGPLASSPRFSVSPSPSCPLMFQPQHLTVVSFCGRKQPSITDRSEVYHRYMEPAIHQIASGALIPNVVLD